MIDVAVWCDYFVKREWDGGRTAKALAYLFKVPKGQAEGTDPGFFKQMETLRQEAYKAGGIIVKGSYEEGRIGITESEGSRGSRGSMGSKGSKGSKGSLGKGRSSKVRIKETVTASGVDASWQVPQGRASVICVGTACVDMQMKGCTRTEGECESIETFEDTSYTAGGSVAMCTRALARLTYGSTNVGLFVPPPVFCNVIPICEIGEDDMGDKLRSLLERSGFGSRNVSLEFIKTSKQGSTGTAVLPIYRDGKRGCWFSAGVNATVTGEALSTMVGMCSGTGVGGTVFGYPNLLPSVLSNGGVSELLREARDTMEGGGIVVVDFNGVGEGGFQKMEEAVEDGLVDIVHVNEEELRVMCLGKDRRESDNKGEGVGGNEGKMPGEDEKMKEQEKEGDSAAQDAETTDAKTDHDGKTIGAGSTITLGIELSETLASARSFVKEHNVAVLAVTRGAKECVVVCGSKVRERGVVWIGLPKVPGTNIPFASHTAKERFEKTPRLPQSWWGKEEIGTASNLGEDVEINANGGGDSWTAGFLTAALMRRTAGQQSKGGLKKEFRR